MLLYNALVHVSGLIKYDKMEIDHHLKSDKQKGKTKSGQTFKKKNDDWKSMQLFNKNNGSCLPSTSPALKVFPLGQVSTSKSQPHLQPHRLLPKRSHNEGAYLKQN